MLRAGILLAVRTYAYGTHGERLKGSARQVKRVRLRDEGGKYRVNWVRNGEAAAESNWAEITGATNYDGTTARRWLN